MPKDKHDLERDVRVARHAQALLDDELIKGAMQAVRDEAQAKFRSAKPDDIASLQVARVYVDVAEAFLSKLQSYIREGGVAERQLKTLN